MQQLPLVSAIITTHNRSELLIKAINSVLNQSYGNIECIVVDDGSTDETWNICKDNEKIIYLRIEPENSKGGNHARNVGIQNAKGIYIAFLDDDDIWLETKIEKQVATFQLDKKTGVVFCGFIINDKSGNCLKKITPFIKHRENIKKKILYSIITVTSTLMIKRDLLDSIDGFDENLRFWQEYELTIRLAQITQFDYINEYLMAYLQDTSDKKRLTNKYDSWIKAVEYIRAKHNKLYDQLNWLELKQYSLLVVTDAAARLKHSGKILDFKRENKKRLKLNVLTKILRLPEIINYKLLNKK